MTPRSIFIGDVHGCLEELDELLSTLQVSHADHLYFLGDLVDRGPDSLGVLARVRELRGRVGRVLCIAGNHEDKALRCREGFDKSGEWPTRTEPWMREASEQDWQQLEGLPLLHHLPESGLVLVHGGLVPRYLDLYDLSEEWPEDWRRGGGKRMKRLRRFLRVRFLSDDGQVLNLSEADRRVHKHWSDVYEGQWGFALYGHEPWLNPPVARRSKFALGLDTGCVFGGRLSALVKDGPEESLVQVEARREYAKARFKNV